MLPLQSVDKQWRITQVLSFQDYFFKEIIKCELSVIRMLILEFKKILFFTTKTECHKIQVKENLLGGKMQYY